MNWLTAILIVIGFPFAIYGIVRAISFMLNLPENIKYNTDSEYRKVKDEQEKKRKDEYDKREKEQRERDRERFKKNENDFFI